MARLTRSLAEPLPAAPASATPPHARVPQGSDAAAAAGVGAARQSRLRPSRVAARRWLLLRWCRDGTVYDAHASPRASRRRCPAGVSDPEQPAPWTSAWRSGLCEVRLRGRPLTFDCPVDRRAANAEQVGHLGGAVLAAVHQRHQVRFLAAVELGLIAA
jgi:hypothetical protein